jgi:predicted carbohydrate-binding protein with CBM5 and CBM33 domain
VNDLLAASVSLDVTASSKLARAAAAALVLAVAPLGLAVAGAQPAAAHGALTNPLSRAAACGPVSAGTAASAACRAAVAASGGQAFTDWDNLRVADVNGRDRERIPDGKLCSGGLDRYRGLDLARADWPATRLRAGARFTFAYRETIPHQGTFRLYVSRDGYAPTRPLRWSDLESKPFLTVTDPAIENDAYVFAGTLPRAKTGRHIIYTIWQNSSTADTYYSCSDVDFAAQPAAAAAPKPAKSPAPAVSASPAASHSAAGSPSEAAGLGPAQRLSASDRQGQSILPFVATGLAVLVAAAIATVAVTRRGTARSGRRRRAGPPGRPDWTS